MPLIEYYQRPFHLFHSELNRTHQITRSPHAIRERFWQFVPPREYELWEARPLLLRYLLEVEKELAATLSRHSLGYWLHTYRRLYPGPIGQDDRPVIIGLTRAALEAAIQKYSTNMPCDRVGIYPQTPLSKVLNGILQGQEFKVEQQFLSNNRQLVLTDFGPMELLELYDTEKLAYEVWKTGATLRGIGKGAPFIVTSAPPFFGDNRSDDLDWLLKHYDDRLRSRDISTAAVVYGDNSIEQEKGVIFLPTYILCGITGENISDFIQHISEGHLNIEPNMKFNFVWHPFCIRAYRDAHTPLSPAFKQLHGVSLDAALLVVAILCWRAYWAWIETKGVDLYRNWQRAYEGPYKKDFVRTEIYSLKQAGTKLLGINDGIISEEAIDEAIHFWTLCPTKQRNIDLPYSGPHQIFLPFGDDRVFIDYAWIRRRLYDLFVGVSIPDQNFKGDALEKLVRKAPSVLPVGACKAKDGTSKQIDAAYAINNHLVIVECKAVSHSIAFDRGDPEAINYRRKYVVERLLLEADAKAKWLAKHPKGSNYSLEGFRDIIPVGVSPFTEFIPSRDLRYWITEEIPRVITPEELNNMLDLGDDLDHSLNRVPISR